MRISPPAALAIWAIGTAWLILVLVIGRWDPPGMDALDWIEVAAAVAGIACYPILRKGFAAWLRRNSISRGNHDADR